jgi:hypothetical protein
MEIYGPITNIAEAEMETVYASTFHGGGLFTTSDLIRQCRVKDLA